jgi:hypothetical protein
MEVEALIVLLYAGEMLRSGGSRNKCATVPYSNVSGTIQVPMQSVIFDDRRTRKHGQAGNDSLQTEKYYKNCGEL